MKFFTSFLVFVTIAACSTGARRSEKSGDSTELISVGQPKVNKRVLTGPLDPHKTWRTFLRLSERNEKKDRRREKKRVINQLKSAPIYARGPIGPSGPRGPRGHRGPKGANVTKEEMFEEFRTMLREIAARKFQLSSDPMCTEYCIVTLENGETTAAVESPVVTELPPLFDVNRAIVVPKVISAFFWELSEEFVVPRKTFAEIDKYLRPFAVGSFERETEKSDPRRGRFVAERTGFYSFFVRIQMQLPEHESDGITKSGEDLFSVMICIESKCQDNINLETISGSGPWHKTTVTVNGLLHLEENQYVSVFIDNYSRSSLRIYDGSQFSGYLAGI